MRFAFLNKLFRITILFAALIILLAVSFTGKKVDYITDVKPIINQKCIKCHGGVRRKGDFSLLFRKDALGTTKSGGKGIIPGDPGNSELIRRITNTDPEDRMPKDGEPLSKEEIRIFRDWIKQGAKWGDHWAYIPVKETAVPDLNSFLEVFFGRSEGEKWAINEIDHFIYTKLKEKDLKPNGRAEKSTLFRRASLDIIGYPASDSLLNIFLKDSSDQAYEHLIDALLSSRGYGEKWTSMWLDLARYADTKGYERDDFRTIWKYRDWLINAFNSNMPYDQFLTEQMAGDLLPGTTDDELIASAFHRNTLTNDEGGTDNEEFRVAATIDRVNTTWEALQGTTFGCVQCHSHPYDPFRHEEYYKFMAYFNNSRDNDTYEDYPVLRQFSGEDSLKFISLKSWLKNNTTETEMKRVTRFVKMWQPVYYSLTCDQFINSELSDTKWLALRQNSSARLQNVDLDSKNELYVRLSSDNSSGILKIHLDNPGGTVIATLRIPKTKEWVILHLPVRPVEGIHNIYLTYTNPELKPNASGVTFDWFHFTESFPGKGKEGYDDAAKQFVTLLSAKAATTPVMMDNPTNMFRKTYVFERGNWLVRTGEVGPSIPGYFSAYIPKTSPDRKGLAEWLTSKKNPLTARVLVNRVWEQLFGTGIVETSEDFGTQGSPPSHQELLDWLSMRFMNDYKWSIKKLIKEIVLSATYRQSTGLSKEKLLKDPANRLLSRGARVRLTAEQLRDQALAVSGLLSHKMYGPGVYPYQPPGIWLSPYNGATWNQSEGDDQYRRAVYTFWKRTAAYPSMITFDGVPRDVCAARRIRTNTPLQALVTLNDPAYLEAARHLALNAEEEGIDIKSAIGEMYKKALGKNISARQSAVFEKLYSRALDEFNKDQNATNQFLGCDDKHNKPGTAALVAVANVIMNLDEFITKP